MRRLDPTRSARPVLLLASPELEAVRTLPPPYELHRVDDWIDLHAAARRAPPRTAVVVDAGGGDEPPPHLEAFAAMHPLLALLPAVRLDEASADLLRTLLALGAAGFTDLPFDADPARLALRLRAAHARPFKRRLEDTLPRYVSADARTLLRAAAGVAADGGSAADLAARFGVGERTVGAWCAREGLPGPRRLLAGLRVLLAVALLEEEGRSVASVAHALGYGSEWGLRRAVGRHLGADGEDAPRSAWSWSAAAERWNDELFDAREAARERRRARRRRRTEEEDGR